MPTISNPLSRTNRLARRLQHGGVTSVNIGLPEHEIPAAGGLFRRMLEVVVVTDKATYTVAQDIYPTPLTRDQVNRAVELTPHKNNVRRRAIALADGLREKGISVSLIDKVPTEIVRAELERRVGHGPERR